MKLLTYTLIFTFMSSLTQATSLDSPKREQAALYNLPSHDEDIRRLEENTRNLQELNHKLEKINAEDMANNIMTNALHTRLKEEFHQMDKNHDSCATAEEYADFTYHELQKLEDSSDITKEDLRIQYQTFTLQTPNCLTRNEYINLMSEESY